jgi:hypothetical protein
MDDGREGEGVGAVVVVGPEPNREFESELSEDHLRFMAPLLSVTAPPPPLTSQSSVTHKIRTHYNRLYKAVIVTGSD